MRDVPITRRQFVQGAAAAGVALGMGPNPRSSESAEPKPAGPPRPAVPDEVTKTPSYNPRMEYRRLGKTGLWISAVALGGHWKRIDKVINIRPVGYYQPRNPEFRPIFEKNREEVIDRCLEVGINCIDACTATEVSTYGKMVKARLGKIYISYSDAQKEPHDLRDRTAEHLMESLEASLKLTGLECMDIWRVTMREVGNNQAESEALIAALDKSRRQGKIRFGGFSSHDRPWIKKMIETYPEQVQVVLFPYTADSRELPKDSLFEAIRKHDVGVLGIKPFASNSLFKGDSSPDSPTREEDDRRARLAIRNILANPAITAPIPGLISIEQVDNMALAIRERRQLDLKEKADLGRAAGEMWARLPADYQWLHGWRAV